MSMQEVGASQFKSAIERQGVALVEFGAPWCAPCKQLKPILTYLDECYGDRISILQVDCDESPEIAGQYGVMSMPTVVIFKDGVAVDKLVGLRPPVVYQTIIDRELGA